MLRYPVTLKPDTNGTLLVRFPDVPEAITSGVGVEDALARAVDALESALSAYVDNRRDIPKPSAVKRNQKSVIVPALSEAKLALYTAMREQGVNKTELARRMGCHMPQIDRRLDLMHASKFDQLEAAFGALGKRLSIEVADAAAAG